MLLRSQNQLLVQFQYSEFEIKIRGGVVQRLERLSLSSGSVRSSRTVPPTVSFCVWFFSLRVINLPLSVWASLRRGRCVSAWLQLRWIEYMLMRIKGFPHTGAGSDECQKLTFCTWVSSFAYRRNQLVCLPRACWPRGCKTLSFWLQMVYGIWIEESVYRSFQPFLILT